MGYWFVCCFQLICLSTHSYDDSEWSSSSRREKCVHRDFYQRTGSLLSELKMSTWSSPNIPIKKLQSFSLWFIFRCAWQDKRLKTLWAELSDSSSTSNKVISKRVISLGGSFLIYGLTNWEGVITQLVSVSVAVDSHMILFSLFGSSQDFKYICGKCVADSDVSKQRGKEIYIWTHNEYTWWNLYFYLMEVIPGRHMS